MSALLRCHHSRLSNVFSTKTFQSRKHLLLVQTVENISLTSCLKAPGSKCNNLTGVTDPEGWSDVVLRKVFEVWWKENPWLIMSPKVLKCFTIWPSKVLSAPENVFRHVSNSSTICLGYKMVTLVFVTQNVHSHPRLNISAYKVYQDQSKVI